MCLKCVSLSQVGWGMFVYFSFFLPSRHADMFDLSVKFAFGTKDWKSKTSKQSQDLTWRNDGHNLTWTETLSFFLTHQDLSKKLLERRTCTVAATGRNPRMARWLIEWGALIGRSAPSAAERPCSPFQVAAKQPNPSVAAGTHWASNQHREGGGSKCHAHSLPPGCCGPSLRSTWELPNAEILLSVWAPLPSDFTLISPSTQSTFLT